MAFLNASLKTFLYFHYLQQGLREELSFIILKFLWKLVDYVILFLPMKNILLGIKEANSDFL